MMVRSMIPAQANQLVRQTAIARPVEKFRECLMAITPAVRAHKDAASSMIPPITGMNTKIPSTPGELEKPIVRGNVPIEIDVSGPLYNFVPMRYAKNDQTNQKITEPIRKVIMPQMDHTPAIANQPARPMPILIARLTSNTTTNASKLALLFAFTSL
jgi:hypothetical protein